MITITKQNDGVLFTFENSDKYLYGNGSILVPFNTLSIVADESDMITLRKAASNDIFLSARYDTDLGYRSKDDAIDDLKDMLFAETGGGGSESGITSGEVQTMIDNSLEDYYTDDEVDAALSGKASISDVTAVANDVQTVSGQVQTKVATSDFNTYSAATATAIGNKYDKVSGLTIQYNIDGQTPEVAMELEDEELGRVSNIFNKYGLDAYREDEETGHQSDAYIYNDGSMGVYEHSEGHEGNEDEGMSYDKQLDIHPDSLEFNTQTNGTDYEQSENVTISKDAITMNKSVNDNGDITESSIEINNNQGGGDGTFIYLSDSDGQLELNTSNFHWTDGTDSGRAKQLNWVDIASTNDILDALFPIEETLLGKADTSAVTAVNNVLTAHTGNTTVHVTSVEKDAWNAKVDTSAITSAITSGSTDSEIPTAKATYDAIQAGGGGGATYSAGTNISIDTANTINCTLPITIKAGTGDRKNLSIFSTGNTFDSGRRSGVIIGQSNTSNGDFVFVIGENNSASANYAFSQGKRNNSTKSYSATFGFYVNSNNAYEMSCGLYNNSVTALTESGQTLFSVGNGTADNARHNAFEIRRNGDIYVNDGTNDVRLQDTILALGGLKLVKLSQSEYDNLPTKDSSTLYIVSNVVS